MAKNFLDASTVVLKDAGKNLRSFFRETEENVLNVVWDWISMTAARVGLDKAWELAVAFIQQLGIDRALVWFAAQTEALRRRAGDVASFLKSWDYQLEIDESGIRESIASVVTTQFQDAISTTDELLRSISDTRKDANMQGGRLALGSLTIWTSHMEGVTVERHPIGAGSETG